MSDLEGLTSLEPLAGGWSGQTFLGEVAGTRTVVRLYVAPSPRGPLAHEVDAALLSLVRGLLPVPRVLEVRGPTAEGPAMLLTEHLPGERGDLLLAHLGEADRRTVGRAVGRLAGTLAGMPMPHRGLFRDATLRPTPWDDGAASTVGVVEALVARVPGWTDAERDGLAAVASWADDVLAAEPRACLVHGDLNPKNLLIDPDTLAVTGLVDTEHAHAGHPATDLGNVLRHDRDEAYAGGVASAYAELRGTDPDRDREQARCADLVPLLDLAVRAGAAPSAGPPAEEAHALLTAIARSGDVHAVPGRLDAREPGA